MRKEKLLAVMLFLSLVAENDTVLAYYHEMWTPARLFEWFTVPLPIKLNVFQMALVLMLLIYRRKSPAAKPIARAIWVSMASLLFCVLYGLARGGILKPIYTQVSAWLTCLVFALTAMATLTTVEDFRRLENAIVWAGVWRSCMAAIFYMKVRGRDWTTMPPHMTTHEDTVLFVVALIVLVSRAIELRTRSSLQTLFVAAPLILVAIQVNNRRLAWASLVAGLLVLYFMLPAKSKVTRKLNRSLLRASPFLALYVAIGWGRPEKIFKPLQSFSSMGGGQVDNSTKARDNENLSLITMIREQPLFGTGLGHEWHELDATYTVPISVFPLYHYCPHNSVLALLAFCGGVGVAGLWMIIPVSVFLNARTYRRAPNAAERSVALVGIVDVVVYLNQAYGDMGAMGVTHIGPATILGAGIACAAKLSVSSGAWPSPTAGRASVRPNHERS
jgi:hypothetical protein